jgi:NADP-dependent 3-hydroxy acid dehydrogenase YdfG
MNRIATPASEIKNTVTAIEADATDRDSITSAAQRLQQELSRADILINTAGAMLAAPSASEHPRGHR